MIVTPATLVAGAPPPTNIAVLDRIWVIRGGDLVWLLLRYSFQPLSDEPKVRTEVVDAKCVNWLSWVWGNYMEELGQRSLNTTQHLGIQSELQNCATARFLCELCIDHLIRPGAKRTLHAGASEDIRSSEPSSIMKRWLKDDIDTGPHGI